MKPNIDHFLKKIFLLISKSMVFIIKIIFQYLWISLLFLFNISVNFFIYLNGHTKGNLQLFFKNFIVLVTNILLFMLVTIPKSFFIFFIKPICTTKVFNTKNNFILKIILLLNFISNKFKVSYTWLQIYSQIFFLKVFKFLKNKFVLIPINLFFRNKIKIVSSFSKIFKKTLKLILGLFILYNYFYIYNYLFLSQIDSFVVLSTYNYEGIIRIIEALMNIDNMFLITYLIFFKVGIINTFFPVSPVDGGWLLISAGWTDMFIKFKIHDSNFSFFWYYINMLFESFQYNWVIPSFDFFNNSPIFFFFGFFFFLTVIISWFFLSYIGLYGIFILNLVSICLFWLSLIFSAKNILISQKVYIIKLFSWVFLSVNSKIDYYFLIDTISYSFILLTTTIALFVYIYAFSYFRYEPLVDRFLLFLLSFVISMIFLVASGNTIMLFLGWELIGFTSFCLINFWTTKTTTLKSAFKAFTFNKISDFYLFMFLITSYSIFYTFDILTLNSQIFKYNAHIIYIFGTQVSSLEFLALMLIGAAFIKSAQLGGHAWLPDSMEAPVPASSLIHSATLVSAGVYLILRFNFIFDLTQYSKLLVPILGSLTAAYGGVCAIAQSDIKKTLAYSTISHCGFLMVLCSTEMNEFTILYLYIHGFFKAGVFMCVGNVLRIAYGYQDTRRMGGFIKYLPFEYYCATIGVLNLAGLPFTFGFFIKHLLLISLGNHIYIYYFIIFNSLIGAFSGLFYSYRIINYTFIDFKKANKNTYNNLNKINYNSYFYTNSSKAATVSIISLFLCSYIISYFLFKYFLFSDFLFSDFINTTINSTYYSLVSSHNGYLLNFSYMNIIVIIIVAGLFFSKFKKIQSFHNFFKILYSIFCISILIFIFFNFF